MGRRKGNKTLTTPHSDTGRCYLSPQKRRHPTTSADTPCTETSPASQMCIYETPTPSIPFCSPCSQSKGPPDQTRSCCFSLAGPQKLRGFLVTSKSDPKFLPPMMHYIQTLLDRNKTHRLHNWRQKRFHPSDVIKKTKKAKATKQGWLPSPQSEAWKVK